jgi:ribosomal protein S18 acetylase RimI-like enzyme
MFTKINISVRPATEADRPQLTSLIQLEPYVHRHLDWRAPLDWLGKEPYLVVEQNRSLIAALACPADPPGVAWIRAFATSGPLGSTRAWDILWPEAVSWLTAEGGTTVAAIPLYRWFRKILENNKFKHTHNVVLLIRDRDTVPEEGQLTSIPIRTMTDMDLKAVTVVDHAAFQSIWQNSQETLSLAYKQAASATVAEDGDTVVGYQISTPSPHGWHLARLAVHPRYQRQGIAFALIRNMLSSFMKRGPSQITVNTQHNNLASLHLYKKAGFSRTGEEYPVYQYFLD